jgi:NAD(P)-dependent dehydrogenase (short-subunit alcohol dehydrogenase family)
VSALDGRRAVVTGASQGIGRATLLALAEAGADVVGCYRSDPCAQEREEADALAAEVAGLGRRALMLAGDVGDPAFVEQLADAAVDTLGGLDVWVNNAGRQFLKSFMDTTDDELRDLIDTNLLGYWYGCRAAARRMAADGGGRIVNVASIAHRQPIASLGAYAVTKGGVSALTSVLAVELGPLGIAVNSVSPGPVRTPLNAEYHTDDVRRAYSWRVPVGRIAEPEEVARAIRFLCSQEASYVNGAELIVDGGLMINGTVTG